MPSAYESLMTGLEKGLSGLPEEVAAQLEVIYAQDGANELVEAGIEAAHMVVSALIWEKHLGPVYDTARLAQLFEVSRQAVAKAVANCRLLAVTDRRYRRFPTWQFELPIKPKSPVKASDQALAVISAFRMVFPDASSLQIASWARSPQPELGGTSPAAWLGNPKRQTTLAPLVRAAKRAAEALTQ